jgi:hypothetical protein
MTADAETRDKRGGWESVGPRVWWWKQVQGEQNEILLDSLDTLWRLESNWAEFFGMMTYKQIYRSKSSSSKRYWKCCCWSKCHWKSAVGGQKKRISYVQVYNMLALEGRHIESMGVMMTSQAKYLWVDDNPTIVCNAMIRLLITAVRHWRVGTQGS